MKIKTLAILLLLFFVFTACTPTQRMYTIQSATTLSEIQILEQNFDKIRKTIREKQVSSKTFTDEEWQKLLNFEATTELVLSKFKALAQLNIAEVNILDIDFMWRMTTEGYKEAREVILAHWNEFDRGTQLLLESFDKQAKMTAERIDYLLNNPSSDNIKNSIILITGLLNTTIKLLTFVTAL